MDTDTALQAFLYRAVTANARVDEMVREGTVLEVEWGGATTERSRSTLEDFSVAARVQARRMGEVYELLYCLENSVRELVERTLREAFGDASWWAAGVPERVRKSADGRKEDDLKTPWHGPRGESPINYVDFPQYADIIGEQWEHFADLLGDRDWVIRYFSEMNHTRRALAHTGTLTEMDVERLDLRVREWLLVVG
jgi:hypothetical protein